MTKLPFLEVWIIDPKGRLPATIEHELARRDLGARFFRAPIKIPKHGEAPAAVLLCDLEYGAAYFLAGFLRKVRDQVLWLGWLVPPPPAWWKIKILMMSQRSGPRMAREISALVRRKQSLLRNAAPAPTQESTTS